jgi:hypothetical protein
MTTGVNNYALSILTETLYLRIANGATSGLLHWAFLIQRRSKCASNWRELI